MVFCIAHNDAVVVTLEDWEGLYINGNLVKQNHRIAYGLQEFSELVEKYNISSKAIESHYIEPSEEQLIAWGNRLPPSFSDLENLIQ